MANTRKLVCTFLDNEGNTMNLSYNYIMEASELDDADVKALMNAIITNGSIFERTPTTAKSAKIVVTTEEEVDIS